MKTCLLILISISLLVLAHRISRSYERKPVLTEKIGDQPRIKVWPQPRFISLGSTPNTAIIPRYKSKFQFEIQHAFTPVEKELLSKAFTRYKEIIFYNQNVLELQDTICFSSSITCIDKVTVYINSTSRDVPLQFGVDESYSIVSSNTSLVIASNTVWGAMWALETISQLITLSNIGGKPVYALASYNMPLTIKDAPRFKWRGLLIDSSRHYLSVEKILHAIDSLSYIKMNVLHWHVVDDQSFPIQIPSMPELSNKGSYSPTAIYTPDDVKKIIQYAYERGIRVVFEFDVPGHSSSWGKGYPNISSHCPGLGVMNPAREDAFNAIDKVYEYIASVSNEEYFHVGGDEIDLDCWKRDPTISEFMKKQGYTSYEQVLAYFERRAISLAKNHGFSVNCWQELLLNYNASVLNLPKDTMITAWTSPDRLVPIVKAGYPALLSGGWYLTAEGLHWNDYYKNEPFDIANFTESEKDLIKGGEACMWGERIDDTDFDVRVFPRIFSVAEKLWSSYDVRIIDGITEDRISHHRCNFVRRGVAAGPVAPDYCSAVYMYKKFSWQK